MGESICFQPECFVQHIVVGFVILSFSLHMSKLFIVRYSLVVLSRLCSICREHSAKGCLLWCQ